MQNLQVRDAKKILGVTTHLFNKIVAQNLLPCNSAGKHLTFSREDLLNFKRSKNFSSLSKDFKLVVFIQAENDLQLKKFLRIARIFCKELGYNCSPVTQIVAAGSERNASLRKATEEMRNPNTHGLLYFGDTRDVQSLVHLYSSLDYLTCVNLASLRICESKIVDLLTSAPVINDRGLVLT